MSRKLNTSNMIDSPYRSESLTSVVIYGWQLLENHLQQQCYYLWQAASNDPNVTRVYFLRYPHSALAILRLG